MKNEQITNMLKLTRALFFLNAAVWLIFGLLGLAQVLTGAGALRLFLSVMMLVLPE